MAEAGEPMEQDESGERFEDAIEGLDDKEDPNDGWIDERIPHQIISKGTPFERIVNICPQPPIIDDMDKYKDKNARFMISPFKYDPTRPERKPTPTTDPTHPYKDRWDKDHVRMPCSPLNKTKDGRSKWPFIQQMIADLKRECEQNTATIENLKRTIENCVQCRYEFSSLEKLINNDYSDEQRSFFMSTVLANICYLALNVDTICGQSLPLLRTGRNQSVTMSQQQAASLLACEFFCLFPYRCDFKDQKRFGQFPKLNFHRLYRSGHAKKIEKLKSILHYFRRITEHMPRGVITFQRYALPHNDCPRWEKSKKGFCDIHLTTGKKIEDIHDVLQVDFANKYIGGGVLESGCVQEEIRFAICPEMLVSLIVCEMLQPNECVFLIGCERYSSYDGYSNSFKFDGSYEDSTLKDNWGRKWCHLVAMDAIYFRRASMQYNMEDTNRELLKAYTSFRPLGKGPNYEFGIATGNWGCGAFHGDKELKAIIQLMAASEAGRPLIYATYRDGNLVDSFSLVLDYLRDQNATVGDLYRYLQRFCNGSNHRSFFQFILNIPVSSLK